MTPQELKNSILQLAIQGKLVEQRPEEGTATELLRDILTQRRREAECAEVGRDHRAHRNGRAVAPRPPIPDDEKPFDIPESWEWARLGEVFQHNTGKALNSSDKTGTPLSYITTSNVYWNRFELGKLKTMLFSESEVEKCTIQKGDLLVLEGGDVGRAAIWNYDFPIRIQNHIHRLRPLIDICVQYVYYIFMLYKNANMISGKGISIKGLSANALHNLLIPLPPLAEQKRIVAKIEELLPLIDRYEKAWSRLEDFNKRFPVDMQKSLLQMAIQGKLVEQRPEEGTGEELYRQIQVEKQRLVKTGKIKKEKPLPEISEDEIPFEIPDSWKWVRLSNVVDVRDGTHDTPKYVSEGVPLVTSKNLVNGAIDFATAKHISHEDSEAINIRSGVDDGDILFAMIGTIGNPVLIRKDREFSIKNMALFKPINRCLFCMEYLMQFLVKAQVDMRKSASASVQSFVSLSFLRNYLFPLPPLAEQKRIVAKLEELLPLCERLK